ncbi:MAG: hypothetical protein QG574_3931, partial [Cyanobacteriota bacterium erpe_2018_sw_21hr_WHONDRS-SW48-000092_B_bin.40]|nr:hypothetical protein [Cyanobacteriota bacterium erpe_2018_sw_21hr_WHONDRS-SW48-000092_B_bin.40]
MWIISFALRRPISIIAAVISIVCVAFLAVGTMKR